MHNQKDAMGLMAAQGFEPVMLVLAKDVTWHDERSRGLTAARVAFTGSTQVNMQGLWLNANACLQGFEPVMLVLAKDVTWHDERFRGPFGARTAHALDMSRHLTLEVNPMDFVIQIPFPEAEAVKRAARAIYDPVSSMGDAVLLS